MVCNIDESNCAESLVHLFSKVFNSLAALIGILDVQTHCIEVYHWNWT